MRTLLDDLLNSNKYGLAEEPAVGISGWDNATNKAVFLVWVKAVKTVFAETACGSGTAAIATMEAFNSGLAEVVEVIQPSGQIITATPSIGEDGQVSEISISGEVVTLYDGELKL